MDNEGSEINVMEPDTADNPFPFITIRINDQVKPASKTNHPSSLVEGKAATNSNNMSDSATAKIAKQGTADKL